MTYRLIITYTNGQIRAYPIDEDAHAGILRSLTAAEMPGAITVGTGPERLAIITGNVASIAIKAAE